MNSVQQTICILLGGIILFTVYSCKEESVIEAGDVHGHWEVIAASRNGKATNTLKDAYFTFSSKQILSTNIYGQPQDFDYELSDNKIMQFGDQETEYRIVLLRNDTVLLNSRMLNYSFDFLAVKSDSILL